MLLIDRLSSNPPLTLPAPLRLSTYFTTRKSMSKQEAVCDLLWSLAFNNGLVKEVVGRQGGIALILKGMSSHLSSPELIKSACGALSNMCQNTYNQNLIAAHGGVRYG